MALINSRFHHIAWDFLLTCIHVKVNGGEIPSGEEGRVVIASPWVNDLANRSLRISSPLLDGVENSSRRSLTSLARVLEVMAYYDMEVFVVTSEPGSNKWKGNWNQKSIEHDRRFQNRLVASGVRVRHNELSHAKSVSTPIGVMDGSANLTDNGFFKNIEHMHVYDGSHADFLQARSKINQLVISDG